MFKHSNSEFFAGPFRAMKTALACITAAVVLSSCQSGVSDFGVNTQTPPPSATKSTLPQKNGPAVGDVFGFGPTRVAMLIPRTAPGNGSAVAKQIQNAAELAISDLGGDVMELVVKDTGGTPAGAITATQAAVQEGSAVVLGPLFSSSVTSARSVITQSGRPLVAFSSDPSAAGAGGYLISFLPDQLVSRSINYAFSQGKNSFTAILPSGAYGNLVERQLRATIQARGGQLLAISKYEYNSQSVQQAITQALPAAQQSDAIFIPDGGNSPAAIIRQLKRLGVDLNSKMVIGTGQWRTANLNAPELQGAVFADMDQARFDAFKQRYSQKFGSEPTVNAALGYDAVLLVGGLLKERPGQQITATEIQSRQGFIGASGIFRFLPSGLNERGLAIFQVQNGVAQAIQAAPSSFSSATQ